MKERNRKTMGKRTGIHCLVLGGLGCLALAACGSSSSFVIATHVSVYETTGSEGKLLSRQASLTPREYTEEDVTRESVFVSSGEKYQSIVGYGAALTHSSAYLLMQADETTRTRLLEDVFSSDGSNFSLVRIPIGASDYIPGGSDDYFSCDDVDSGTDEALSSFSLSHDEAILTVAKQILGINPNVRFMAAPWSAPAWMKQNDSMTGGGALKSGLDEVYAAYLAKFAEEYHNSGIDISWLSILNEPGVGALSYPTMDLTADEAATITSCLGEDLAAAGLSTKLTAWDFNYGSSSSGYADLYLETLFDSSFSDAGDSVDSISFHGYDSDGYYSYADANGLKAGFKKASEYGKDSFVTEITESSASTDFAANLTYACKNIVVNPSAVQSDDDGNFTDGVRGALYWNLVLDSEGNPTPAYHENACYGVLSLDEKEEGGSVVYDYSKSSAFYALSHLSKFLYPVKEVAPRAIEAVSDYSDLATAAFYRNDGAVVVCVCNTNETNGADLDVVIDDAYVISYDMVPQSVVTFVC
jgi:glucosylceramidase